MIHATISLSGLYTYDNTVLDNLVLPEDLDRETVIENLLFDTVELELLYPDADVMKQAVGFWSKKRLPIWQKLYDTTVLEYNPIWNVDGMTKEERTVDETRQYGENIKDTRSGTDSRTGTDNRTGSGTEKTTGSAESESDQETAGNTLNKSNTFNSGSMIDNEKTETDGTGRTTASGTTESNTTRTETDNTARTENGTRAEEGNSKKTGDETGKTKEILETERHGNIGITTTQQMIREEREVAEFDVIQYIIDDFKTRFCLLVY